MLRFIMAFCLVFGPHIVLAQTPPANPNSEKPLEISAENTIEWHRNTQKYIARGAAMAKQGDVTIRAETLTADYRETDKSGSDIYRLTATDGVVITSDGNTASGDLAVYDVESGKAEMTGNNLRMVMPEQIITARDSFVYNVPQAVFNANGKVRVVHGEDTIDADRMVAILQEGAKGDRSIKRLEAYGNVVITTPTEVLRGNQGHYTAATQIAEISGNVKITRGPNILEGERAEVNLATNISRMFGSPAEGGRVKGTFYPGSEKSGAQQGGNTQFSPVQPNSGPIAPPQPRPGSLISP